MWSVKSVWVGLAMLLAVGAGANAEMQVIGQVRAGPQDYHKTYGNIINTVVTIEDFFLRTNEGKVIKVNTAPMTIDLQDPKGIPIDLRNAKFPQNQNSITVVEIETRITTQRQPYINSAGGTRCNLTVPKLLNLYTRAEFAPGISVNKAEYLVQLEYSPLNAIQIDVVTQQQQEVEPCDCFGKIFSPGQTCDTRMVGKVRYRQGPKCELVNRRHAISGIVLK